MKGLVGVVVRGAEGEACNGRGGWERRQGRGSWKATLTQDVWFPCVMRKPAGYSGWRHTICVDTAVASSVAEDEGEERATHGFGPDQCSTHTHTSPMLIHETMLESS